MSRMKLSQDTSMGSTMVPNYFIDEYLSDANDAQIKVYLFLLRLMTSGKDTSISDIADEFNYTEKDIMRAIAYWEKKDLLRVTYDHSNEISSLCFLTPQISRPNSVSAMPEVAPAPIVSLVKPLPKEETSAPSLRVEKTEFSIDALATLKEDTPFGQILSVAEVYLARSLSMTDIQSLAFIYDTLHFSFELLDYLIDYCVGKGKKKFTYIEEVARNWHENGITTVSQAKDFNYQYNKNVYLVMKALGRRSDPTAVEAEYVKRWYDVYGFDEDVILEACARTVRKVDKNRFEYAEGILSKWFSSGILHMSDVIKADEEFSRTRQVTIPTTKQSRDSFNNFPQRNSDYAAIVKELTGNS